MPFFFRKAFSETKKRFHIESVTSKKTEAQTRTPVFEIKQASWLTFFLTVRRWYVANQPRHQKTWKSGHHYPYEKEFIPD